MQVKKKRRQTQKQISAPSKYQTRTRKKTPTRNWLIWSQNIRKNGYCSLSIQSIKVIGVSFNYLIKIYIYMYIKWNEMKWNPTTNIQTHWEFQQMQLFIRMLNRWKEVHCRVNDSMNMYAQKHTLTHTLESNEWNL